MRQDGVPSPAYMLHNRFLLRVSLTSAGGGSGSRTELLLRLISRPKRALGKAWSDRPELRRAQIGGSSRCAPLPRDRGGPEGHRCRVHFNNLGWRNLISAFTEKSVRIISDPNNPNQGNVLLWLAFDQSQSGLAHRFVLRSALPTFGKGNLSLRFYAIADGAGISPRPRLTNPPSPSLTPGWKPLGSSSHRPVGKAALAARMRRDGVRATAYMLQHKYLVRLSISGAGGGRGHRSELILKTSSKPSAALGTAWSDHRGRWGAQIGARSLCRPLARALNPYGSYGGLRWHSCPIRYNGLGWRNLISAFSSTEMMLITVSRRRAGGNQVLWLAFDRPQALLYKLAGSDRAHRMAAGTLKAEKFVHGQGGGALSPSPRPGGLTAWRDDSGTHRYLPKNSLYWKIRRDGFSNPWFLLKKRYLVRLQIASSSGLSHTVLRLANPPGVAVGTGLAPGGSRSGVQAGALARCMSAGSRPRCPLHYANLGWRNLSAGLRAKEVIFITTPSRASRGASTIVWMAFDNPQSLIRLRNLRTDPGRAAVTIGRYRW